MIRKKLTLLWFMAALIGAGCNKSKGRYAPINGIQLYYEEHGKIDGVPLLLLHGGGSTLDTSFAALIPHLSQHRRVIAFDQQGHGRTADRETPFSFVGSAKDAVALLRHLKIEKADIMGFSNGGHIAVQIAIDFPQVVRKLIVESAMTKRAGAPAQFWVGFNHAKIEGMPSELQAEYKKTSPHPAKLQSFFDKSVARMKNFTDWDDAAIHKITVPVLVLAGDRDIITPEHAVELLRLFPQGELCILPGLDHVQMTREASLVAPVVLHFLGK